MNRRLLARLGIAAGVVFSIMVIVRVVLDTAVVTGYVPTCPCGYGCGPIGNPACGPAVFLPPSNAAQTVAGVIVLVATLVLLMSALLREASTQEDAEDLHSSQGSNRAARPADGAGIARSGPRHPGSGDPFPQPLPTAPSGSGSTLNLPSLPDTPDVPESPEDFDAPLSAQRDMPAAADETNEDKAAEAESDETRHYTAGALAQMQALDISPARVEEVIRRGAATAGPQSNTTVYTAPIGGLLVTLDASSETVVAVERHGV